MSRKWFTLGLLVFAAACGGADDDLDDLDTIETEEQTLPPPAPMDTMGPDTMMMGDTLTGDTMGM